MWAMTARRKRKGLFMAGLLALPAVAAVLLVLVFWQGGQAAPLARDVHPNGAVLSVHQLSLRPDQTLVAVEVKNRFDEPVYLNARDGTHLVDDFGRQYPLDPPPGNPRLEVLPGQSLRADLGFQGAPGPGARRLFLVVNSGGAVRHGRRTSRPYWRLELPLREGRSGGGRQPRGGEPLARGREQGLAVEVHSLRKSEDRISLALSAVNHGDRRVFLNKDHSTVLRDDRGYEYPLRPPGDNSELRLGPRDRADLTLVFVGRPRPEAGQMFLAVNDLGRPGRSAPRDAPRLHLALPTPSGVSAGGGGGRPPAERGPGGLDRERLVELLGARHSPEGLRVTLLTDRIYQGDEQKVSEAGRRSLARLAELIRRSEAETVKVVGHTDSRGDASYNQSLSEKRAEAVVKWLLERPGMDRVRFRVSGAGERRPAGSNQTAAGRRQNRRVEVLIREG
jgi:outer membrane protein OmpA-like peptidoglycan-associated protein